MSKTIFFNEPLDQPHLIRPGITEKTSDFPGAGKWTALPPEDPIRHAKGDLGNLVIPGFESHYSFEGGVAKPPPFSNLKKGK